MPVRISDQQVDIIGTGERALNFYDDDYVLQAQIYLKRDGTLNLPGSGTTTTGGSSSVNVHALSSGVHTGILSVSQMPQALLLDGSRDLTGDLSVDADVTIDGVDLGSPGHGIEVSSEAYRIAAEAAGDGLQGGAGSALAVDVSDFAGFGLEDDGAENLRIAASAAGSGLTGGGGSALALDWGTPTIGTIEPDDSASAGTSTNPARSDHTHAIAAATASELSVSESNAEGTATSFARSDHVHAITTSSNPGAAASILASNASGELTLQNVYVPDGGLVGVSGGVGWTFDNTGSELEATATLRIDGDLDFVGAQSITTTAGNLTLAPAGDLVLNPTGNDVLPNSGYDINLGSVTKKYLTLHAAELWVQTLVAQDVMATIGGRIITAPTTMLATDLGSGAGDTTITVEHNNLANGDTVVLEADGNVEWMLIGSAASDNGDGTYDYTVTRDRDGSGRNAWYAGDAVVSTGASGDGFIDQYSVSGVVAGSTAGPTVVGNVRNSDTYDDYTEAWAIGNLNGLYGYATDIYGVALGKYSAADYLTVEPSNGVRFLDADDTVQAQLTGAVWTIGEVAASKSNVQITAGAINLRTNTTTHINLATDGSLWAGDSDTTERLEWAAAGLSIYDKDNDAVFRVDPSNARFAFGADVSAEDTTALVIFGADGESYSGETFNEGDLLIGDPDQGNVLWDKSAGQIKFRGGTSVEAYIDTDGAITAGGGNVWLDSGGYGTEISSSYALTSAIKFYDGADVRFRVYGVHTSGDTATRGYISTEAPDTDGWTSQCVLAAQMASGTRSASLSAVVTRDGMNYDTYVRVDDDLRAGAGLYVGATDQDPDTNDVWLDGDIRAAGGAYFGGTVASDDPGTGYVVATSGVSGWLPFTNYVATQAPWSKASNNNDVIFVASIDRSMTVDHWTQAAYVTSDNNGNGASDYWTISLQEWDGTVIDTVDTSGESADTRLSLSTTGISHSLDPSTDGQQMVLVLIQATGSPGDLYLYGPAVYVL
jgi:hypothetical protein